MHRHILMSLMDFDQNRFTYLVTDNFDIFNLHITESDIFYTDTANYTQKDI